MTSGIGDTLGGLIGKVGSFFGEGSVAQQFLIWGVLQQIAGAALAPATADIAQAVNALDPVLTLTPEQLAVGTLRGLLDPGDSESEAAKSGIGAGRFAQLQLLAGQPASLGLLIQAAQRQLGTVGPGMSTPVDVDATLADLGIAAKYHDLVKAQIYVQPSAAEVLNAWLEGQIEADEAIARISATGLDPSWIQTAYNANGQAPTPNELLDLWNRGIIPESGTGPDATSYEQGYLEGPFRNKWLESYKALRNYIPPPRSVTAMWREGSLTTAQATAYLNAYGVLGDEVGLFLAPLHAATSVAQRTLTQAQIIDLYESRLISADEAHTDLVALKFSAEDATYLIELADLKAATASTKTAVTRLQNLYLSGANSRTATQSALHALGLTDANVTNLLATWDLEQSAKVRTLTESQIVAAWFYDVYSADAATNTAIAVGKLVALGYSGADATILIETRNHGPLTADQGGTA